MASYKFDAGRGQARIFWRLGDRQMTKVLRCATEREAQRACMVVEETIQDIARGKLALPEGGGDARPIAKSGLGV